MYELAHRPLVPIHTQKPLMLNVDLAEAHRCYNDTVLPRAIWGDDIPSLQFDTITTCFFMVWNHFIETTGMTLSASGNDPIVDIQTEENIIADTIALVEDQLPGDLPDDITTALMNIISMIYGIVIVSLGNDGVHRYIGNSLVTTYPCYLGGQR